ncbi:MAG: TIGR02221 family CRISPR-associated protein [Clostridiales bacterium]|nr:TIGR02221 family CRISPR-associated protein [Clostridiales bacterium]
MARHFISALGTNYYKEAIYYYEGSEHKCRYLQEALGNIIFKDKRDDDKITVLLTKEARDKNWEIPKDKSNVRGLKETLESNFEGCIIETLDLPKGRDKDEFDDIFNRVFECIDEGDDIYFDITYCFRHLPIFILSVLYYAKVLKKTNIRSIYYGAYDMAPEAEGNELKRAPIFDLIEYIHILDWSMAAQMFIKYGNANMMHDVYNEQKLKGDIESRKELTILGDAVKSLMHFTNCILTSRGMSIDRTSVNCNKGREASIEDSYKTFKGDYQKIEENNAKTINPIKPLFKVVLDSTEQFDVKNNLDTGLATVQWCIDKGFTQQGLTALEETIKTYICFKYGYDETEAHNREYIAKRALNLRNYDKRNKVKGSKASKAENEYTEDVKKVYNDLSDKIVKLSNDVSVVRNNINHFGYNKDILSYKKLHQNLEKYFNDFKEICKNK